MKISTTSWHFRWMRFCWDFGSDERFTAPKSLCLYPWKFLFGTIRLFGYAVIGILFTTLAVTVGLSPLLLAWSYWHNHSTSAGIGLSLLGLLALLVILFVVIMGIWNWWEDVSLTRAPGLIGITFRAIKAGKEKVCPNLEYTV